MSVILLFSCADKTIEQLPITTNSEKARKHYQKAREYYLTTDFPEGWSSLDSALAIDPNFAMASLIRWHPDPSIRAKNRKKGIGKKFTDEIVKWAFTQKFLKTIRLNTYGDNLAARKCYRSIGFKEIACKKNFRLVANKWKDLIIMEKKSSNLL